jgi:hypothetical protein
MASDVLPCTVAYCDRPAVAWVSRRQGGEVVLSVRLDYTDPGHPVDVEHRLDAMRCLDHAHDELDMAFANTEDGERVSPGNVATGQEAPSREDMAVVLDQALLGSDYGELIHPASEIPAGEIQRLIREVAVPMLAILFRVREGGQR